MNGFVLLVLLGWWSATVAAYPSALEAARGISRRDPAAIELYGTVSQHISRAIRTREWSTSLLVPDGCLSGNGLSRSCQRILMDLRTDRGYTVTEQWAHFGPHGVHALPEMDALRQYAEMACDGHLECLRSVHTRHFCSDREPTSVTAVPAQPWHAAVKPLSVEDARRVTRYETNCVRAPTLHVGLSISWS